MDNAKVPALRTARLICAMERFAVAYRRANDEGARAEAYALWCETLRDLAFAESPQVVAPQATNPFVRVAGAA